MHITPKCIRCKKCDELTDLESVSTAGWNIIISHVWYVAKRGVGTETSRERDWKFFCNEGAFESQQTYVISIAFTEIYYHYTYCRGKKRQKQSNSNV